MQTVSFQKKTRSAFKSNSEIDFLRVLFPLPLLQESLLPVLRNTEVSTLRGLVKSEERKACSTIYLIKSKNAFTSNYQKPLNIRSIKINR